MFKLAQLTKDHREAPALCSQVNLFGFVDDEIFLTKSGDLGIMLSLAGVDYECLDTNTIENLTRRLAAAFRIFDEKCRVYQYLFKRNREHIPFKTYENPVVDAAIQNRIAYLNSKADSLYSFQICYVVLYEGFRYKTSILGALGKLSSEPRTALTELRAVLSTRKQLLLLDGELERARTALRAKARAFLLQVGDFVGSRIVPKEEAFRVLKQILNFSPLKIENARLTHDTFLDYYLCESHLECHRGFLRVSSRSTTRYFVDRFPLYIKDGSPSSPVITFTYFDPGFPTLQGFTSHLRSYTALFQSLREFHLVYVAASDHGFHAARSEFSRVVKEGISCPTKDGLIRYFVLRRAWEAGGRVEAADVVFLNAAKNQFRREGVEALYQKWCQGITEETDFARFLRREGELRGTISTLVGGESLSVFHRPSEETNVRKRGAADSPARSPQGSSL